MSRRCRAGDEKYPDIGIQGLREVLAARAGVMTAPPEIMEGIFRGEAELTPEFVGDEAVEPRAFVHFVKVRQCLSGKKFLAVLVIDGGTLDVVE